MLSTSSRRTFVKSLAAGGVVAGLGIWRQPVWAVARPHQTGDQGVLAGTQFDLIIDSLAVNFSGRERTAIAINGSIPGPLLRWREGNTVRCECTTACHRMLRSTGTASCRRPTWTAYPDSVLLASLRTASTSTASE